ncbi:hypothetical protein SCALM49S_08165 [Streptomyces californicus]
MEFGFADLLGLPAVTRTAFVECAGNGRAFFTSQQGQAVTGTAWTLGAIGTARWRGVRLADVLRRAGIGRHAVDVLPRGLDAEVVTDGVNLGRVRRPLPVAKALDDVLLAYEMNGVPLPPDHGFPVRLIVPSWVGIANIKWVGDIEVSGEPLLTTGARGHCRLFGPGHPPEGSGRLPGSVEGAFGGRRAGVSRSPGLAERFGSWRTASEEQLDVGTDGVREAAGPGCTTYRGDRGAGCTRTACRSAHEEVRVVRGRCRRR